MATLETDSAVIPSPAAQERPASSARWQRRNYEAVRFNALQHGILSRHSVLAHEDAAEYRALLTALVDEHQPAAATAAHLVEELAGINWRKRRVLQAESANINKGLKGATRDAEGAIPAAAPFELGLSGEGRLLACTPVTLQNDDTAGKAISRYLIPAATLAIFNSGIHAESLKVAEIASARDSRIAPRANYVPSRLIGGQGAFADHQSGPGDAISGDSVSAGAKTLWWRIHFPDRDPVEMTCCPGATHAEVLEVYPAAIAPEPFEPILQVRSTPLTAVIEAAVEVGRVLLPGAIISASELGEQPHLRLQSKPMIDAWNDAGAGTSATACP